MATATLILIIGVDSRMTVITRKELAKKAHDAGMNITERTLRFWAMKGLIPKPIIHNRRAYYDDGLMEKLQLIESMRAKSLQEMKDIVWKSDLFDITTTRIDGVLIVRAKPKGAKS